MVLLDNKKNIETFKEKRTCTITDVFVDITKNGKQYIAVELDNRAFFELRLWLTTPKAIDITTEQVKRLTGKSIDVSNVNPIPELSKLIGSDIELIIYERDGFETPKLPREENRDKSNKGETIWN